MKIYLIYAKIDIELWEKKLKTHIQIYQSKSYFGEFKYDDRTDSYIGLYAWTHEKSVMNMFKESRRLAFNKGMYTIKEIKLKRDDFIDFMHDNKDKEIVLKYLQTKKSEKSSFKKDGEYYVYIVLTRNEYELSTDDSSAREEMFESLYYLLRVDYYAFDSVYKMLLQRIGYATEFDANVIDDNESDYYDMRSELANYNMSYKLSPLGTPVKYDLYGDKYALFKNIYFEMIVGYTPGDLIHEI